MRKLESGGKSGVGGALTIEVAGERQQNVPSGRREIRFNYPRSPCVRVPDNTHALMPYHLIFA